MPPSDPSAEVIQNLRRATLECLELLGSIEAQLEYQRTVPIADVSAELFCMWFDDLGHCYEDASVFREEELEILRAFSRKLEVAGAHLLPRPPRIEALVLRDDWRAVAAAAAGAGAALRAIAGDPAIPHGGD